MPTNIVEASPGWRVRFAGKSRVGGSHRPGVAALNVDMALKLSSGQSRFLSSFSWFFFYFFGVDC
jgi:hypothetical protein